MAGQYELSVESTTSWFSNRRYIYVLTAKMRSMQRRKAFLKDLDLSRIPVVNKHILRFILTSMSYIDVYYTDTIIQLILTIFNAFDS